LAARRQSVGEHLGVSSLPPMPNRYGDHDGPDTETTSRQREVSPHPQAAITNCSLLRPLNSFIAALVVAAEREHGRIGRRRVL
jgi:hypothetical protein